MMLKIPESDTYFRKGMNPQERGAIEFAKASTRLTNRRVCLDIGAHVGVMSLRYAQHFQTVHAFEPLIYEYLVENTKHLPNVITHNYAVSNKSNTTEMYSNPLNTTGGIIPDEFNASIIEKRYLKDNAPLEGAEIVSVECVPIDSFGFIDVDLIKIDVEGHILPTIEGMINTLNNNSAVVQIEISCSTVANNKVHQLLSELGYVKFDEYVTKGSIDYFYYKPQKYSQEHE